MSTALLIQFVDGEEAKLKGDHAASIWAMQHAAIQKALSSAKSLDDDTRVALFYHLLRRAGALATLKQIKKADFDLFCRATVRHRDDVVRNFESATCPYVLLYLTGIDRRGALASGPTRDLNALKEWGKLLSLILRPDHIPGIVKGHAKYQALGPPHGGRSLELLEHLNYVHDRREDGSPGGLDRFSYDYTSLPFWGFLVTALVHPETRAQAFTGFLEADLPARYSHLLSLEKICAEIEMGPDAPLVQRLTDELIALREPTEGNALAKALALPVDVTKDWEFTLTLPIDGNTERFRFPKLELIVGSAPDQYWAPMRSWALKLKRDADAPALDPPPTLAAFPQWLKTAGLQPCFDALDVTNHRKLVKPLKAWASSAG